MLKDLGDAPKTAEKNPAGYGAPLFFSTSARAIENKARRASKKLDESSTARK
jgi:hypothetical protein